MSSVRMSCGVLGLSVTLVGVFAVSWPSSAQAVPIVTRTENFNVNPPLWGGSNNTTSGNNYGYRTTQNANGAAAGEAGGSMNNNLNSENYYGDKFLYSLTLNDAFSVSLKFDFNNVSSTAKDADIGYFSQSTSDRSFIGLGVQDYVGTATKIRGQIALSDGTFIAVANVLGQPSDRDYTLTFSYNPNVGFGQFTGSWAPAIPQAGVGSSWTINLTSGQRTTGASFDGFGLYSNPAFTGNGTLDLFIDDATYSAAVPEPASFAMLGLGALALLRRRGATR